MHRMLPQNSHQWRATARFYILRCPFVVPARRVSLESDEPEGVFEIESAQIRYEAGTRRYISVRQRGRHASHEPGVARHFPQHSNPGTRHGPDTVHTDLGPSQPLAPLHQRSAFPQENLDPGQVLVSPCRTGTSPHSRPISQHPHETPGLMPPVLPRATRSTRSVLVCAASWRRSSRSARFRRDQLWTVRCAADVFGAGVVTDTRSGGNACGHRPTEKGARKAVHRGTICPIGPHRNLPS
ncbi:hypothetical protein A8926_5999 [Saccharopolyspora spinosa]|uniref:Uncharacterized protein n=1 Tax=Saccharopolyspora spinosa TaxID=60894 RepID=A0A2N3Y4Y1_SACSN|nr:hypothetical protein A8926_5999 [Saccharopolyspora spinosa]